MTIACKWPDSDILFILDGSFNINLIEHQQQIDFLKKCLPDMRISDKESRLSVVQYTPSARLEFGLMDSIDSEETLIRLQQIMYSPCDPMDRRSPNCTISSVNSISKMALISGNRKWLPDVVVVISTSKNRIPEVTEREVLISPISPMHYFHVMVNGAPQEIDHFESSATTIRMSAVDFNALSELVHPLCTSVNQFIGGANKSAFGSICWTVTAILVALIVLLIIIAWIVIYSYKSENDRFKYRIFETEKALRSQNEYFTAKLHSQMEDQIAVGKKHAEEMERQKETLKEEHDRLRKRLEEQPQNQQHHHQQQTSGPNNQQQQQQQPILIPFFPPDSQQYANQQKVHRFVDANEDKQKNGSSKVNVQSDNGEIQLKFDGDQMEVSNGRISTRFTGEPSGVTLQLSKSHGALKEQLDKERRHRKDGTDMTSPRRQISDENSEEVLNHPHSIRSPTRLDLGESTASKLWNQEGHLVSETSDTSSEVPRIFGHLPADHPARTLPPIDILFLVDSSSSIGITNFESMKSNIVAILEDVDIGPGRSRVALIQYAQEPSVVFGFDKYYSYENVKRGVNRMSYTGGATMLAKALSFASGVLYKEQNMKESRKRHKLMPTPRHDRIQILGVVSDGASDDNIDKAASYLHEKLQVKVFGLVSKSFNKDKLLPITRFEGSIFVLTQKESISIWLWRQQKLWADNYDSFIEREKSFNQSVRRTARSKK